MDIFELKLLENPKTHKTTASGTISHNNIIPNRGYCTNYKPPSGQIRNIFRSNKVSDNNHRVYLRGYRGVKTRYRRYPKYLYMVTLRECVEYYRIDWEDFPTWIPVIDRL